MKRLLLTLSGALLLSLQAMAQTPELVHNIAPGTDDSNPGYLTTVNNNLFFVAYDDDHGPELWMKLPNDTPHLVKDIRPGASSSLIDHMIPMNGKVYFNADEDGTGYKLWVSDGTAAGTTVVKDVQMLAWDFLGGYKGIVYNNKLYFTGSDNGTEYELWVTDGTNAGTQRVKDIFSGPLSSTPSLYTIYNGLLYFTADGGSDRQLWVTDGTDAGTHLVSLINASDDASPGKKAVFNNRLYFGADDGTHGIELWSTDGTDTGTHMLKDMNPGSGTGGYNPFVAGGKLFFIGNDGTSGRELAITDGTDGGTQILKDIYPTGDANINSLTEMDGKLYFGARGANPSELWVSDGTNAGTTLVHTLATTTPSTIIEEMIDYNHKVYFCVSTPSVGRNVWGSDGTDAGTVKINVNPAHNSSAGFGDAPNFAVCDDSLYWPGDYGTAGLELYRIGTIAAKVSSVNNNELKASLYPNPASGKVEVSFSLSSAALVQVTLTDLSGHSLKTYSFNNMKAGTNNISLNLPAGISKGIYLLNISSGSTASALRFLVQ